MPMNRRTFLSSSTATIALPFLESAGFQRFASASNSFTPPKRMMFLGIGYGVTAETWFPNQAETGKDYRLTEGLQPLARHRNDFSIVQNATNKDSAEAHWGSTFWLTGANRYGAKGSSFHNTISADQVAAEKWGDQTRFSSLHLNGSDKRLSGPGHGPGLSLAWDRGGKPVAGINDPVALFHRLFSAESVPIEERKEMLSRERSILDSIMTDAQDLRRGLTQTDNEKLDEYFDGIRDIELQLGKEENWMRKSKPNAPMTAPRVGLTGVEEVKVTYDLMAAAMQTDSTRVLTYRQPIASILNSIGTSVLPLDMSHYTTGERMKVSQQRDRIQSELLAGLIDRLKSVKEVDGSSLFDHTCLAFGTDLRNRHCLDNSEWCRCSDRKPWR